MSSLSSRVSAPAIVPLSTDITMCRRTLCYQTVKWDPSSPSEYLRFIHPFNYSILLFVLCCFVPGTILGPGVVPPLMKLTFYWVCSDKRDNKQTSKYMVCQMVTGVMRQNKAGQGGRLSQQGGGPEGCYFLLEGQERALCRCAENVSQLSMCEGRGLQVGSTVSAWKRRSKGERGKEKISEKWWGPGYTGPWISPFCWVSTNLKYLLFLVSQSLHYYMWEIGLSGVHSSPPKTELSEFIFLKCKSNHVSQLAKTLKIFFSILLFKKSKLLTISLSYHPNLILATSLPHAFLSSSHTGLLSIPWILQVIFVRGYWCKMFPRQVLTFYPASLSSNVPFSGRLKVTLS